MFNAAILILAAWNAPRSEAIENKELKSADRPTAKTTSVALSNATLPEYLKKFGYKVEVQAAEIGADLCVITIDRDGWGFDIEATVTGKGGLWFTASLVRLPAEKVTSPKFLQLLEANALIGPCSFLYRAGDGSICIRLQVTDSSEAGVSAGLALLTEKIRQTFPIWGQGSW